MNTVDLLSDAARLRAFLAVVEHGGFSRAAAALGVTQPTVSSLVAALERRVGSPLVVRSRSGTTPTPAGAALVPHAERLLAVAEEAVRAVDAASSAGRRRLAVAGGEALVTNLLPPALAELRGRLPRLTVTLRAAEPGRALAELRSGEVGCVLMSVAAAPDDVAMTPVADDTLVLVGSADGPSAVTPVPLAEVLAGATLVVREAGRADRAEIDALLRQTGVEPAERMVVAGLEAALRAVEAGLGVAMLPGVAVRRELADGRLRAVPVTTPLPRLTYGVGVRRGGPQDPVVAALTRILVRRGGAAT